MLSGRMAAWKVLSYNNMSTVPEFINDIELVCRQIYTQRNKEIGEVFSGTCHSCGALPQEEVKLQRCAGCQLVAYCNKNCQRVDWKQHKNLCKKYPVVNGQNVIVRKAPIGKHPEIHYRVMRELHNSICTERMTYSVFTNGINIHFCNICHEARPQMLFNCRCCSVSYCSQAHRLQDKDHLTQDCDLLYGCAMANWYLKHHQLRIPDGLLNEATLKDGLNFGKAFKSAKYSSEKWLETIVHLINERLSVPLTIHHALKKIKLGEQRKNLSEITSLTIHIVHSAPMLDPRVWEFFMHQLPNLKELNITFVSGQMILLNKYNTYLPVERCSDCREKQRVITYNIQDMHYHEYFASDNYVEPDVVFVIGIDHELVFKSQTIDNAHSFTNQRNMIYSKHTIVILADDDKNKFAECVVSFHDDIPVKVLLPVQKNPFCGFSTLRFPWNETVHDKIEHICCIQRNH